jgi:predicted nucleotidyltransferase
MCIDKRLILNDLTCLLKKRLTDNIKDVVLFGSRISEDVNKDSDYDILIILTKKADWTKEREISDICYEVELQYNIIIDTHILGEEEFSTLRGKQPIFFNAMLNGIHA